jgi:hypothetical protein
LQETSKKPLDLNLYEQYSIDQTYSAFILNFSNINQEEADNLEHEYTIQGYKIFHTEMSQLSNGSFELTMIVAKLNYTF